MITILVYLYLYIIISLCIDNFGCINYPVIARLLGRGVFVGFPCTGPNLEGYSSTCRGAGWYYRTSPISTESAATNQWPLPICRAWYDLSLLLRIIVVILALHISFFF